jgi:hypothetical protein
MEKKVTLQDTLKSKDTEEWVDLVFYRPMGYLWALFFEKINVTPNAVSILSIFLGVAAGVLFYYSNIWLNVLGMALLVWANTYDSADGQLARMTGNYSRFGRILDGAASNLWFISIYAAICLRLTPEWGLSIWILAAITGYFHVKQAAMADYFRNFHLLFAEDNKKNEFDDAAKLKKQAQLVSWKNNLAEKFFLIYYSSYTRSQEQWTPRLQVFRKALTEHFGETGYTDDFREAFRKVSKPMMKYTNILSFNTRATALFVCLLAGFPWVYFLFELSVLNIVLLYLLLKYEAICKMFTVRLRGND